MWVVGLGGGGGGVLGLIQAEVDVRGGAYCSGAVEGGGGEDSWGD